MTEQRADVLRSAAVDLLRGRDDTERSPPGRVPDVPALSRVAVGVTFESARHDLLTWSVQRRAGLRVSASGDVAPDTVVDLSWGVGPFSVTAPCRVVDVVDGPDRCGFAYGTLPGHPESGEESFVLTRGERETTFTITVFSRPATVLAKVAGPVGHRVQDLMTARYLRAFT